MQALVADLGYDLRSVLGTNLAFVKSQNGSGVSRADVDVCWPVHEAMLAIVQPKLIIAFGNDERLSPYSHLRRVYGGEELRKESGHGTIYILKAFETKLAERKTHVLGLPHLSYYSPSGKPGVIDWLKEHGGLA